MRFLALLLVLLTAGCGNQVCEAELTTLDPGGADYRLTLDRRVIAFPGEDDVPVTERERIREANLNGYLGQILGEANCTSVPGSLRLTSGPGVSADVRCASPLDVEVDQTSLSEDGRPYYRFCIPGRAVHGEPERRIRLRLG